MQPLDSSDWPEEWPKDRIVTIAKDQPEYIPLVAAIYNNRSDMICTFWGLTWRERFLLLLGAPLRLEIMRFRQPLQPIRLGVDETIESRLARKSAWDDVYGNEEDDDD